MDGSQKLPQRILGTIRDDIAADRRLHFAALAVAAWMRYVYGEDEQGRPIAVSDPMAPEFAKLAARHAGNPAAFAQSLFAIDAIFDQDLHNEPRFTTPVTKFVEELFTLGAARTVSRSLHGDHAHPPPRLPR
jgi:fructuronate reductase